MTTENNDKNRAAESPAVQSLHQEQQNKAQVAKRGSLQEAVEETFPASDPVSLANPTKPGGPEE